MGCSCEDLKRWYREHPWLHWSYFVQWFLTALVGVLIFVIGVIWEPYCRFFHPTDPGIWDPYKPSQTFPNWTIPIIGWLLPFMVGLFVLVIKRRAVRKRRERLLAEMREKEQKREQAEREADTSQMAGPHSPDSRFPEPSAAGVLETDGGSDRYDGPEIEVNSESSLASDEILAHEHTESVWHEVHCLALCMWQACMMATLLTQALKFYSGRQRPDFISRLQLFMPGGFDPMAYNMSDTADVDRMMTNVCSAMGTKEVMDGFLSFPSGHASFSFAGWTVVCLFVAAASELRSRFGFGYAMLAVLPCFPPGFIAVSRTRDNRHHWSDVLGGSVIGMIFGALAFGVHYSMKSTDPYNSRTGEDTDDKIARKRKEELRRQVGGLVLKDLAELSHHISPLTPVGRAEGHALTTGIVTPRLGVRVRTGSLRGGSVASHGPNNNSFDAPILARAPNGRHPKHVHPFGTGRTTPASPQEGGAGGGRSTPSPVNMARMQTCPQIDVDGTGMGDVELKECTDGGQTAGIGTEVESTGTDPSPAQSNKAHSSPKKVVNADNE